jgi:hypothetical protein
MAAYGSSMENLLVGRKLLKIGSIAICHRGRRSQPVAPGHYHRELHNGISTNCSLLLSPSISIAEDEETMFKIN